MSDIIVTEQQLLLIRRSLSENKEDEKEILDEAWYNTAMEVIGLVDPTPITDTINAISYFSQGNTLFGVLSLVSAIPFYVGDIVAKPVMGALKLGSASGKQFDKAYKLSKIGTKEATDEAVGILQNLAKEPGPVGSFLQKAGGSSGWATKVNSFLDELPMGPFKGMKNTIKDYFSLLGKAGDKSVRLSSEIGNLLKLPTTKNLQVGIPKLKDFLKNSKIIDVASMSKPGMFNQVFFGGLPRFFRSPEGRRVRILMQKTKWWLGFLDYIGLGNWVGEEEVIKKLGSEAEMQKALEKYQQTPEAKKYFDESLSQEAQTSSTEDGPLDALKQQTSAENLKDNPLAQMVRNMFMGQLNPIPGM